MWILLHSPKLCIDLFALKVFRETNKKTKSCTIRITVNDFVYSVFHQEFHTIKKFFRLKAFGLNIFLLFTSFLQIHVVDWDSIIMLHCFKFQVYSCILHFQSCILKFQCFGPSSVSFAPHGIICLDTKSRFIVHRDSTRSCRVLSTFFCLFVCCCIEFVSEYKLPITSQVHTQGRECT